MLADSFGQARLTQTVSEECLARDDRPEGHAIREAVEAGWLAVQADVPYSPNWNLGAAEASAIAAALALHACLLIDDRAGRRLTKGQEGQSREVREIAWKAQVRLCGRYRQLCARGKEQNKVIIAVARELAGFVWAIARATRA